MGGRSPVEESLWLSKPRQCILFLWSFHRFIKRWWWVVLCLGVLLMGLWHGQKWLHLFVDSEAYHEQMGSIPSSYGSLDLAYPMRILRALADVLFRLSTHQNWPRDRKLPQSCWCLHWFLGLRPDVWQMRLQVYTRLVITQVWIEKPCNKNVEIGFQSAVFHLCQWALVPLLCNATASI